MEEFESILKEGSQKKVNQFYTNIKKLAGVEYNKEKYAQKLNLILMLSDEVNGKENTNYTEYIQNFGLNDFKQVFQDLRQTLMYGNSKKKQIANLLQFYQKTDAIKRYRLQYYND